MRVAAIAWCFLIPGLQVYLFRRKRPDLLKNHMEGPSSFPVLLAPWVKRKLISINYSELSIEFANGSKIFLCHCQHEKDRFNYQGAEIHVLMIDELTHFTETIYRFLRGRCRLGALKLADQFKGLFPKILCGANPGGVGHNWVKAMFVDNAPYLEVVQMGRAEGGMLRQYIPALLTDNQVLMESDPEYADRLAGLGNPELVRAMLEGDWDIVAGGMVDDLWRRHIHVIKPFPIPPTWRVDRSFDWGSSRPFAVLWFAESDGTRAPNGVHYPRGTLFHFHEWYGWNKKPNEGCKLAATEVAKKIKQIEAGLRLAVKAGPADGAIYNSDDTGRSIADDMKKHGVHWVEADKSPGSRVAGAERIRQYLKACLPVKGDGGLELPMESPGLFVFENCTQFIRTVPVLPRDEDNPDDVDTEAEDHCWDALRYRILAKARPGAPSAGGSRPALQQYRPA
jgi:hypothetical protein